MKSFFRFLRGELNGFYLQSMQNMMNVIDKNERDVLGRFNDQEFTEEGIQEDTLFGIGEFAGVFLPRIERSEAIAGLVMTSSHLTGGNEYSERGLFSTVRERFSFYHLDESYTEDINTESTVTRRSSMAGTNDNVEGYIASSATDVLDDDGLVKEEKVLDTPPESEAYTDFYGNNFLFLSENRITYSDVSGDLYINLVQAMQWIRYNGNTLQSLLKIINSVCGEQYLLLYGIERESTYYTIYYLLNNASDIDRPTQRWSILQYIIGIKFQDCVLVAYEPDYITTTVKSITLELEGYSATVTVEFEYNIKAVLSYPDQILVHFKGESSEEDEDAIINLTLHASDNVVTFNGETSVLIENPESVEVMEFNVIDSEGDFYRTEGGIIPV